MKQMDSRPFCRAAAASGAAALVLLVVAIGTLPAMQAAPARAYPSQTGTPPFEVVQQLGGLVEAFVADGDRLYLGLGSRLMLLDANTATGVPEGGCNYVNLPHTITDAAVVHPGAVAVLAEDTVYFVDVSEPIDPSIEATYEHGEPLYAIESWNGSLFLLGDEVLFVVDASEPLAAEQLASLTLPVGFDGRSRMLAGDGVVFVGRASAGVIAIDVSDPAEPALVGGIEGEITVHKMAVAGRRLYVHDGSDRFDDQGNRVVGVFVYVLEVLPNGQAEQHGFVTLYEPRPVPPILQLVDMAADGAHLYISGSGTDAGVGTGLRQIKCWDFTDPKRPVETSSVSYSGLGSTVAMLASGGMVFVASNDATLLPDYRFQSPGIGATDARDPDAIVWKGYWQLDDLGSVSFLDANEQHVVIQEGHSPLLHVYDGPYEAGKRRSGYIYPAHTAEALGMVGPRVYTLGLGDLSVFDIGDPDRAELLATAPVTTRLSALAISEPYVFTQVGCGSPWAPTGETYCTLDVLELITRGGAADIVEIAQKPVGQTIRDIAVSDGYAYIVTRDQGALYEEWLALYDVRDPGRPRFVKALGVGAGIHPKRTVIRSGLAYVATRSFQADGEVVATGLSIIRVSDPVDGAVIGLVEIPTDHPESSQWNDRNGHLALSGDYALYSSDEPVVHVVDVADPSDPLEVQRLDVPAVVVDIDAASGLAYVVLADGGMIVLRAIGHARPPDRSRRLCLPVLIAPP